MGMHDPVTHLYGMMATRGSTSSEELPQDLTGALWVWQITTVSCLSADACSHWVVAEHTFNKGDGDKQQPHQRQNIV
jgi:hypothetical protein